MILADYFYSKPDETWDTANLLGITNGVIRLPEDDKFDFTDPSDWKAVYDRFNSRGIKPVVIEPLPNALHDHIKAGDEKRDESIEKLIKMLPIMDALDTRILCFNFMAYVGWTRTSAELPERGGARVTGFKLADYEKNLPADGGVRITADELWKNYTYMIKAVIPEAEKYGIKFALHPDDPPLLRLGNTERIMISADAIEHAVRDIVQSDCLGVTFCQATYHMMGEKLEEIIPRFADKIFFVHFRNCVGTKTDFRETFHDNGDLNMAYLMKLYKENGVDVPVRVDHVPSYPGESSGRMAGYDALGRHFAVGYLKGIIDSLC